MDIHIDVLGDNSASDMKAVASKLPTSQKRGIKVLFRDGIVGAERLLRRSVARGVTILIAVLVFHGTSQYFATGSAHSLNIVDLEANELLLAAWQSLRNVFLSILVLDLIFLVPTIVILYKNNLISMGLRTIVGWCATSAYVLLSYATAGLVLQIMTIVFGVYDSAFS